MRILTAFLAFMAILVGLLAGAVVALAGGLVPPRQRPLPAGWVHVPVWVGPPPQPAMPVIEAEFVSDPRRG